MRVNRLIVFLLIFISLIFISNAAQLESEASNLCRIYAQGHSAVLYPDGDDAFYNTGDSCSVSCYKDDSNYQLLQYQCFPEDTYYLSVRSDGGFHGGLKMFPSCSGASCGEDPACRIAECQLTPQASGYTAETNDQKCAGNVKPFDAAEGKNEMLLTIADVWGGNSYCCGNKPLEDWGDYNPGTKQMCLLPDSDYDTEPSVPLTRLNNPWKWAPANAEGNKLHIYNIDRGGKNWDVVSNGADWFVCEPGIGVPADARTSGSTLLGQSDEVGKTNGKENEGFIEGEMVGWASNVDQRSSTLGSTNIFILPYKKEFGNVKLGEISGSDPDSLYINSLKKEDYDLRIGLGDIIPPSSAAFNMDDPASSQMASAFMCYKQDDDSRFAECCGASLDTCVNTCGGLGGLKLPCERLRRQGEPLASIIDFNLATARKDQNQVSVFAFTQNGRSATIDAANKKVTFRITNWNDPVIKYENLEFFLAWARSSKIRMQVVGSSRTVEVPDVAKYAVNGKQPMKWHRIKIPLSVFSGVGIVKKVIFLAKEDYHAKELASVSFKSQNFANVYFVDRLSLTKDSKTDKFCTQDHQWINDLDSVLAKTACFDTPGYLWTAKPDEALSGSGPCCGDDDYEIFSGGSYAGCWKGVPVINNTRITSMSYSVNGKSQAEICSRGTCYFNIPYDYSHGASKVNSNYALVNNAYATDKKVIINTSYNPAEQSGNDLKVYTNDLVKIDKVPLKLMYLNKEFYGCNVDSLNDNSVVKDAAYCDIKGDFFCSYGNTHDGAVSIRSEWSDENSGTAYQIERNLSNDLNQFERNDEHFNKSKPGYKGLACCPADYCWNGVQCVEGLERPFDIEIYNTKYSSSIFSGQHSDAFSRVYTYQNKSNDFSMYVCEKTKRIDDPEKPNEYFFEAEWKKAHYRAKWDNTSIAYCLDNTECYTGIECVKDGWYTDVNSMFTSRAGYSEDGRGGLNTNPIYMDGDHYCESGNWTSRTKIIAEHLLDLANKNSPDNYTLHCDEPKESLNYLAYEVNTQAVINYIKNNINNENDRRINNVCVLKYHNDDSTDGVWDIAIGASLNQQIGEYPDFMSVLGVEDCSGGSTGLNAGNNEFNVCKASSNDDKGANKAWYNNMTKSVIYSHHTNINIQPPALMMIFLNFFKDPAAAANDLIRNYIRPKGRFTGSLKVDFIQNVKDFGTIYLAKSDHRTVFAVKEVVTEIPGSDGKIGEYLTVNYYNFTTDLCNVVRKYQENNFKNTDSLLNCEPVIKDNLTFHVFSASHGAFRLWKDMTAMLRIKGDQKGDNIPIAKILAPADGVSYDAKRDIDFRAEHDPSAISYYWDLNVTDLVNGERFGEEFALTGLESGYHNVTLIAITENGTYALDSIEICVYDETQGINVCDPDNDDDFVCDGAIDIYNETCVANNPGLKETRFPAGCKICAAGPDNCPTIANPDQANSDFAFEPENGVYGFEILGDVCDDDKDNDGVSDTDDKIFVNDQELDTSNDRTRCGDRDKDGCDDCSYAPLKLEVSTGKSIVRSSDNRGSEMGLDTDNDGYCDTPDVLGYDAPFSDSDDDNDGVYDISDRDLDGNDASKNKFKCGDVDLDKCDDCQTLGKLVKSSNGKVYDDGLDLDGDGMCDKGDTDCTDNDGDGLGAMGTELSGCLEAIPDEIDTDFTSCGDYDDDGCEDCRGVDKITRLFVLNQNTNRIHNVTNGGSEIALDTDNDGLCDEAEDYPGAMMTDDDDDNDNVIDIEDFNSDNMDSSKDPLQCGDIDNDGCDDCGAGPRNVEIVDGKEIVRSKDFGGSEAYPDRNNDGKCDGEDDEPPTVEITPSGGTVGSMKVTVSLIANEDVTCEYGTGDFVFGTGIPFTNGQETSSLSTVIDVTQGVKDRINTDCSGLSPEYQATFNYCVASTAHLPQYCVDQTCRDQTNLIAALANNDGSYCSAIQDSDVKYMCEANT